VEVNAVTVTGVPGDAEHRAALQPFPGLHLRRLAQMAVHRGQAVAVVDDDDVTVAAAGVAAGDDDAAISGGQHQPHRLVGSNVDAERVLIAERARQNTVERPGEPERRRRDGRHDAR
jgi:hypothetical protein